MPRPSTALSRTGPLARPRTGMLEAKDTGASALKKTTKKRSSKKSFRQSQKNATKNFSGKLKKKKMFKIFFRLSTKFLPFKKLWCSRAEDSSGGSRKFWWGGMIKILSTKPQKFGCFVTRRVARNSQWSSCFRVWERSSQRSKILHFFAKII